LGRTVARSVNITRPGRSSATRLRTSTNAPGRRGSEVLPELAFEPRGGLGATSAWGASVPAVQAALLPPLAAPVHDAARAHVCGPVGLRVGRIDAAYVSAATIRPDLGLKTLPGRGVTLCGSLYVLQVAGPLAGGRTWNAGGLRRKRRHAARAGSVAPRRVGRENRRRAGNGRACVRLIRTRRRRALLAASTRACAGRRVGRENSGRARVG
jgi:hypothetical protein